MPLICTVAQTHTGFFGPDIFVDLATKSNER